MKRVFLQSVALGLAVLAAPNATRAQVVLNPQILSGTVQFNNANPAILSLLNPPGSQGMSSVTVQASSLPPAAYRSATSDSFPATSFTTADYQMTLDSDNPGIFYTVVPVVQMLGVQESYYFGPQTSAPVVTASAPAPLNFNECVGVVTVKFVTADGNSVAVDGGRIIASDATAGYNTGILDPMAPGITEQQFFLHGNELHTLQISVHRGLDYYVDRTDAMLTTNLMVNCDDFVTVLMVIPDASTLATVTGTVDMLGEFELTVAGTTNQAVQYPNYTTLFANYGPFGNQRWAGLPGVNFTVPSSGTFTLSNVVPSTLDPLSVGYQVYAQMVFRTNHNIEIFSTPQLESGMNPPLAVSDGATLDLRNLFQIDPGYMRGNILLQGPAESLGHSSLFRGVLHASDDDADHDGIPDAIGTYGVYWTTVEAIGVDRLAPGATYTASGGVGYADFPGSFNPATSAYEGQYELALGGLNGESSIWKQTYLSVTLGSPSTITNDDDYFYNVYSINENGTNDVQVTPSQPVTSDINYCFSEVKIVFRSTTGTFYNPTVRFSSGAFTGTDFKGNAANYSVSVDAMAGTPNSAAAATNVGQVNMYLPQGTYTLYPNVTPASGTYSSAGLAPINITVGCRQRIAIEPCLQVKLNAPDCSNTRLVHLTGAVSSCGNAVSEITYTLNGGGTQTICTGCGADPSFAFQISLTGECADNVITVTATDANGGVSSVTTTIHYDATPPVIQCPADIISTTSCATNGAVVNFTVSATDNCPGPVSVVCAPASGSLFPPGTNAVLCVATDACGNSSQCSFNVIVVGGGSQLTIQPAIIVTWTCGGTLQSADSLLGPWTDVPGAVSPYAVPVSDAQKFYRVRN